MNARARDAYAEALAEAPEDFARAVWPTIRRHAPLPTLTRKLDLGDLGEVELDIEYDAGPGTRQTWDTPASHSWFHLTAIYKPGGTTREDFLPALTRLLGEQAISDLADFIAPKGVR